MKTLILDGSPAGDPMGERLFALLGPLLASRGHEVERVVLRERRIANCAGCFNCWLKTPGICMIDDDSRELTGKFVGSGMVISLTPLTFGVYSPELKRMYDRLIPNVSPFFTTVHGETHHRKRYHRYPDLMTIGWLDGHDETAEAIFRHLVYRNSVNFYAESASAGILYRTQDEQVMAAGVKQLLACIEQSDRMAASELPVLTVTGETGAEVRRAVLLVGSPRMGKSTSASLGGYLFERLAEQGVETRTIQLYQAVADATQLQEALELIYGADLTVLAFPLYIDSLPYPVLSALRSIAKKRSSKMSRGAFAALANCGFIEASHNLNALAACALFARNAGFDWKGSISIGGGEGLVKGRSLHELSGPAIPLRNALDQVALALRHGLSVPEEARMQLSRPFAPAWIYRMVGGWQWKKRARRMGTEQHLFDRPYQQVS